MIASGNFSMLDIPVQDLALTEKARNVTGVEDTSLHNKHGADLLCHIIKLSIKFSDCDLRVAVVTPIYFQLDKNKHNKLDCRLSSVIVSHSVLNPGLVTEQFTSFPQSQEVRHGNVQI
jgi:hypothetical protein